MSPSSAVVGDRRRQAFERMSAQRQRPDRRSNRKPMGPPSTSFYVIAFVVTGLTLLGLVMVFSASAITSFHRGNSPWRLFNRQLLWAVFGGIAMVVAARVPYYKWRRFTGALLAVTLALMFLPFVPGLGRSVNESRAWVFIGPIGFQPSEFLKVGVLVYGAHVLARGRNDMSKFWTTVKPLALAGGSGVVLCALQGDLGSAIVLAAMVFAVVFIAGSPVVPMVICGVGASAVIGLMALSSTRRFNRFTAFLDITAHKDHLSYQVYQRPIEVGLSSVGSQRLHLRGDRRRNRTCWRRRRDWWFLATDLLRHSSGYQRARSIWNAACWRSCCLACDSGRDQRWRRQWRDAGNRSHTAVRFCGRQLVAFVHGWGRTLAQCVPSRAVVAR